VYAAQNSKHDKRLVFQVSGKLWQRSLVMRDLQTGSLWSHILGEAMGGPLKGTTLKPIPSVITSWGEWKKKHPKTTVLNLDLSAKGYDTKVWEDRKRFVLGIEIDGKTKAWTYSFLGENPVQVETFAGKELLIVFLKESSTAFSFETGGTIKSGKLDQGEFVSDEGTRWNLWTAKAMEGPQKGTSLTRVYALPSYRRAWHDFHPDSVIAGETLKK
tara:strand:+ start:2265 stop:2909 length:645 start_codon:yes stop_codon:yes gene_type:complete